MDFKKADMNLLLVTREKLRIREESKTGKKPLICSDEALNALLKRRPKYKKELAYIPGLGTEFMNNYGDEFMRALKQITGDDVEANKLSKEQVELLKKYEARLINLNRRNRLLCTTKLRSKYGFDLYEAEEMPKVENFILRDKGISKITLLSFNSKSDPITKDKARRIRNLLREIKSDAKETGTNDLYIGYPYIEGKIVKEDFIVRAPLVLFPVKIKETSSKIEMLVDEKRDIKFNSNLFLAFMRFNNVTNIDIPEMTLENLDSMNFLKQVKDFYAPSGLKFVDHLDLFSLFEEYTYDMASTLFKPNEFKLVNNAVLGEFPFFSSAIQSDIRALEKQAWVTNLVYDLLIDTDTVDVLEEKPVLDDNSIEFNEDEHVYINSLDFAQENVLERVSNLDRLVIQGPPGTGKSQTITSVIADVVTKGKNVLVVSQKKAALDVIYNRLGELSKYAIMLTDLQDKGDFYKQVSGAIYNYDKKVNFDTSNYQGVASQVKHFVAQADDIKDALINNKLDPNHTDMSYVFEMNEDNFLTQDREHEFEKFLAFSQKYENTSLDALTFGDYVDLYLTFKKGHNLELFKEYIEYKLDGKWFINLRKDLDATALAHLLKECTLFNTKYEEANKKHLLAKWFALRGCKKAYRNITASYFNKAVEFKYFVSIAPSLVAGLKNYRNMIIAYDAVHNFDKNTIQYGNMLFLIAKNENITLELANKEYFDFLSYTYINKFETNNTYVYGLMKNYKEVLANINVYDKKKREMGKDAFKDYMNKLILFNSPYESKYKEVAHYSEATKQPSISSFINKYDFELFSNIRIWLMTPEVVSECLPLKAGLFDYVIFDEASQLYVEKGIPSIYRGKNVIIAGDNKQLRPSSFGFSKIDDEEDEDEFESAVSLDEESLLDLARFKYPQIMLNYHYRSHYCELINFSNFAFYNAKLNIAPNIETPEIAPIEAIKVENGIWENRANKAEATKVIELIKDLLVNRTNHETIGVITFNVTQMNLIQQMLDEEAQNDSSFNSLLTEEYNRYEDGEDKSLFIKNIENVQGDERDIIIFSLAYAADKTGKICHNYGWLNQSGGENRLNVAITRAKQKIYIVKSLDAIQLGAENQKNNGPKILRKYVQYAEAISARNNDLANEILLSFTSGDQKYDVYNQTALNIQKALKEKGIECELNVGIGNYYIDCAIKKNNKYILGLEFDDAFKRFTNPREREIHRRRFLENKGWKIMRVFGALYFRDKDDIINRIVKYYNEK